MKKYQMYQPLLLRIIHGLIGIFVIGAAGTGYWLYDVFDGRWGQLFLPRWNLFEVHSVFGVLAFILCPFLVIYAFNAGKNRLIQSKFLSQTTQTNTKIWWYNLHRLVNTFILVSLTFALLTGQMMEESWLSNGELDHLWYLAHLLSWVILIAFLAFHVLLSIKVGGIPLVLSMFDYRYRLKDSPLNWPKNILFWLKNWSLVKLKTWWNSRSLLHYLEALILATLAVAGFMSILNESI